MRSRIFFRLELADALRSRWFAFVTTIYLGVFATFVWLGLRESSVLGFTGVSRVLLNVANAIVVVVPLLALVSTSQTVVRARTGGTFELLLTQPCRRRDWFRGMVASRLVVLLVPLAAAVLVAAGVGLALDDGDAALWSMSLRSLGISAALVWAFVGVGVWLSTLSRTADRAIVYALGAWLLVAALHDFALIGTLLQVRVPPRVVFAVAAANPVESARIALLSGADPDLSVLGPVGFWLAHALGAGRALAVGIVWPALLGTAALVLASRRLDRLDLVA
jgi:ABC-2 type transport system permease protein